MTRLPGLRSDWRGLPADEQERRLEAYLEEDRQKGFALQKAPLLRLAILDLDDERAQVVWTFHHILLDGWSLGLFLRDVMEAYVALRAGREPDGAAPRPYRDFVEWLSVQDRERAEAYWREALRGLPGPDPARPRVEAGAAPGRPLLRFPGPATLRAAHRGPGRGGASIPPDP